MLMENIESNEPTFLRKLRGEYGDTKGVRHERPLARPRKEATVGDDEDDQPTFVVEGSHDTMSPQQYEALLRTEQERVGAERKQSEESGAIAGTNETPQEVHSQIVTAPEPAKERLAAIGEVKKKRNIVAIGAEEGEADHHRVEKREPKAKKGKKVKLSFDQAE